MLVLSLGIGCAIGALACLVMWLVIRRQERKQREREEFRP